MSRRPSGAIPADIWVLIGAAFIVAIGYGIIAPVLPQFAESFGVGITAATIVVSSFAFFRLISAPMGGRLVDRLGERPVYVTGLLIVAASTFAVALAQTYWQLLLFRALGGLGSTMFTVSAMALLIRMAPPDARARASGMYATAFLLGNIAGPVVGGLMAGLGMRVPFVIYALALVVAAAVVRFRLGRAGAVPRADEAAGDAPATVPSAGGVPVSDPAGASDAEPSPASDPGRDSGPAPASDPEPPMRFRDAWAHSAYRAALASALANGWASMGIRVSLYPLFALHVLGAGAAVSGLALTVFAIGTTAAVTVSGRLADVHGRMPFALVGLLILGTSTIVLGFSTSITVFFVLSAVAGLGAGLLNPAQQATVADVVGSQRSGGVALSRFQMSIDAGAIAGPIVAGVLAESAGYPTAFAVSGVIALLAVLAWLGARETLPARADD